MSSKFLKSLANLAGGYNQYEEDKIKQQKAEEDRQYQLELREQARIDRERKDAEYQETQTLKQGLKERALPGEISSTEQVVEDESGGHSKKTYSFGGKQFDSEEEAKKFATDPVNVLRRQSAFLAERGLTQDAVKYGQLAQSEEDARLKRKETEEDRQFGLQATDRMKYVFEPGANPFERALELKRKLDPGSTYEMSTSDGKITITQNGKLYATYTDDNEGRLRLAMNLHGARSGSDIVKLQEFIANRDDKIAAAEAKRQAEAARAESALLRAYGAGQPRVSGSSSGSGSRNAKPDPATMKFSDKAVSVFESDFKEYTNDQKGAQLKSDVALLVRRIADDTERFGGTMDPAFVASVAQKASRGEIKGKPAYDPRTGTFNLTYDDLGGPNGSPRAVVLKANMKPEEAIKLVPEEERGQFVQNAIASVSPFQSGGKTIFGVREDGQPFAVSDPEAIGRAKESISNLVKYAALSKDPFSNPYYSALEKYAGEQATISASVAARKLYPGVFDSQNPRQIEALSEKLRPDVANQAAKTMQNYRNLIALGHRRIDGRIPHQNKGFSFSSGAPSTEQQQVNTNPAWNFGDMQ